MLMNERCWEIRALCHQRYWKARTYQNFQGSPISILTPDLLSISSPTQPVWQNSTGICQAANPELQQVDMSKLDVDGDGQITKEELEQALAEPACFKHLKNQIWRFGRCPVYPGFWGWAQNAGCGIFFSRHRFLHISGCAAAQGGRGGEPLFGRGQLVWEAVAGGGPIVVMQRTRSSWNEKHLQLMGLMVFPKCGQSSVGILFAKPNSEL